MRITELRNLGAALRESMITTTANADALTSSLMKKLKTGKKVVLTAQKVAENVFEYSFEDALKEEAIEVVAAEQLWKDNKDSAKTYISNQVYFAKPVGEKYEVTVEKDSKRKPFATLSKVDFSNSFTPMRSSAKADAEGYVQYRDVDEVQALQYNEDTVKLNTGPLLSKGDYLVRKVNGDDFIYEVKKSKDFETAYTEK